MGSASMNKMQFCLSTVATYYFLIPQSRYDLYVRCPPLRGMLWHGKDWSFFASGKWYMVLETICFQETLLWLFRRSWTLSSLYSTLSFWIARHDFFKLLKMMLLKAEKTFKISPSSNKSTIQYLKTKQFHVYVFFKCVLALGLQKHFVSIIPMVSYTLSSLRLFYGNFNAAEAPSLFSLATQKTHSRLHWISCIILGNNQLILFFITSSS